MKKNWAGLLLGLSLCVGSVQVLHAQNTETFTTEAWTDVTSEENFESEDADAGYEKIEDDQATEIAADQEEEGFFSGNSEEASDSDAPENDFEKETEPVPVTPSPLEEEILDKIPEGASVVILDVSEGSDITTTLNMVLQVMGQRASDENPCTVIIPPGNYLLSDTICMYSNLTLLAKGAVLTKACTDKHAVLRLGNQVTSAGGYDGYRNITIEGGTWDLNYSIVQDKEGAGGFVGFRIGHARHVTVKDVTFLNNLKSHFLELAGVEDVSVTDCTFRGYWQDYEAGGQECIQLDACLDSIFPGYQPFDGSVCENVRIENNTFEDVFAGVGSHSMIYDRPYRNVVIRGNTFRNIRKRAVWCLNYVDSVVENNLMENVGGGVLVSSMYFPNTHLAPGTIWGGPGNHQVSGITVTENQISVSSTRTINGSGWSGYGIQVQGMQVPAGQNAEAKGIPAGLYKIQQVTVTGNSITGPGNGIRLYLADDCKVTDNVLNLQKSSGFSNMGIYLCASSQNQISQNQISGCKNVGIYAYNGGALNVPSVENQILENIVSGTGGDGILLENGSDRAVIGQNRITSGKKNGLMVWGSDDCQITGNQITGCALDGIYLESLGNALIKSNKVTDVKGRGIQVISSQTSSLYGNMVTGSKKCGLYVSQSKIKGYAKNRLEKNGSTYAIYASESTGILSVKLPTASTVTRKSKKITGKAAGGKTLTIYAVTGSKSKKIGKGSISSKKKFSIPIKKQKKGTVLRLVLTDKYGNTSYTNKKVK